MQRHQTDSASWNEHDGSPQPGSSSHFQGASASLSRKNNRRRWLMLAIFGLVAFPLLLLVFYKNRDFLVVTDAGVQLDPKTQRDMEESIRRLYNCEQYALVALKDGYYPCLTCLEKEYPGKKVYLRKKQIWKYGTTCVGQKNRGYSDRFLLENHLEYLPQFEGTETGCKAMERRKIYSYPLLPENLQREFPLRLPPGNKNYN